MSVILNHYARGCIHPAQLKIVLDLLSKVQLISMRGIMILISMQEWMQKRSGMTANLTQESF